MHKVGWWQARVHTHTTHLHTRTLHWRTVLCGHIMVHCPTVASSASSVFLTWTTCRAGLVLQLQQAVGYDTIQRVEDGMANKARALWARHPNILVAGRSLGDRIGIVSFLVRHSDTCCVTCVFAVGDLGSAVERWGCDSCESAFKRWCFWLGRIRSHC